MAEILQKQNIPVDFIVFPPMSGLRRFFRGYNQSELLTKMLTGHLQVPVRNIFQKIKTTKKQSMLTGLQRTGNLLGSIGISPKFQNEIKEKNILFVDDVISTGSTAKLCGELLKKYGAKTVFWVFLGRGM